MQDAPGDSASAADDEWSRPPSGGLVSTASGGGEARTTCGEKGSDQDGGLWAKVRGLAHACWPMKNGVQPKSPEDNKLPLGH
jgi:hypothetical protein